MKAVSIFLVSFCAAASPSLAAGWLSPQVLDQAEAFSRSARNLRAGLPSDPVSVGCPPPNACRPNPYDPARMRKDLTDILLAGRFPIKYFWFAPERIKDKYLATGTLSFEKSVDGSQLYGHLHDDQTDSDAIFFVQRMAAFPSRDGERPFARAEFALPLYRNGDDPGGFTPTNMMTVYWQPAYWDQWGNPIPGVLTFEHLPVYQQQPYRVQTKFYPRRDFNWIVLPGR